MLLDARKKARHRPNQAQARCCAKRASWMISEIFVTKSMMIPNHNTSLWKMGISCMRQHPIDVCNFMDRRVVCASAYRLLLLPAWSTGSSTMPFVAALQDQASQRLLLKAISQ